MLLPFGKYKGQMLNAIFKTDKRYIEWLVTTPWYNQRFGDYAKELVDRSLETMEEGNLSG